MSAAVLTQYVIYDHPRDHPGGYVVREWLISTELTPGRAWTAPTLDGARALIPPGLVCLGRDAADDPKILEVWT